MFVGVFGRDRVSCGCRVCPKVGIGSYDSGPVARADSTPKGNSEDQSRFVCPDLPLLPGVSQAGGGLVHSGGAQVPVQQSVR